MNLDKTAADDEIRALQRLDEICEQFEASWRSRTPTSIERMLQDAGPHPPAEILAELLKIEIYWRQKRGENPRPAEYESRFPEATPILDAILSRLKVQETVEGTSHFEPTCDSAEAVQGGHGTAPMPSAPTVTASSSMTAMLSPPEASDEIGRLGGYRVLQLIGEGGMGRVFLAEDISLKRRVALKIMRAEIATSEKHRSRFLREAQAAAALQHDHIVPIYQVGDANGVLYISMQLLRGQTLAERLKQGPLTLTEALGIAVHVADGLTAAHELRLVHRDIKPANIVLEKASSGGIRAKILDFGMAHLGGSDVTTTPAGAILGTPAYMSPEQARGSVVDSRSDLFSLGCVLYELICQRRPFAGQDTLDALSSLALDTPASPAAIRPEIPTDLSELVMELLEKDPARRPDSPADVRNRLRAIRTRLRAQYSSATDSVRPLSAGETSPLGVRSASHRNWWLALAIAAPFVLLAATQLLFRTPQGTLIVDLESDAVEARFKAGELRLFDADGVLKYTLKPSQRDPKLSPGEYRIAIVGVDGLKVDTDRFEMRQGDTVTVRVTFVPDTPVKEPAAVPLDLDRQAALWTLARGGRVTIRVDDMDREIAEKKSLPKNTFTLIEINLAGLRSISDDVLSELPKVSHLGRLDLGETGITNESAKYLESLPSLKTLILTATEISGPTLQIISKSQLLEDLWLNRTQIQDDDLRHLVALPRLTSLMLDGTSVSNAGAHHLKALSRLEYLYLAGTRLEDDGLEIICDNNQLLSLTIGDGLVTEHSIPSLLKLKQLETLSLENLKLGDEALRTLASLTSLVHLSLAKSKISNSGLSALRGLVNLRSLYLNETAIDDDGVQHLLQLTRLVSLEMTNTQVADRGVIVISELHELVNLNFSLCRNLTDDCTTALSGMKSLRSLNLNKTRLSLDAVKLLRSKLPDCVISSDHAIDDPSRQ